VQTPDIPVVSFSEACAPSYTCVPQYGTSQQLDSLGDRLMYRLAYRNFGDHDALVVNHSVAAGSSVGVRWYELRSPLTGHSRCISKAHSLRRIPPIAGWAAPPWITRVTSR